MYPYRLVIHPHHEEVGAVVGIANPAGTPGAALMNLNALEGKLPEVLASISAQRATVMENISVAG